MEEKLRKEKTPELKPALKKPKEEPSEKKSMPAAKPAAPKETPAEQVAKVETVSDKVSHQGCLLALSRNDNPSVRFHKTLFSYQ